MKTTILILSVKDWEFNGKNGTRATFLMEKADKVHSSNVDVELAKSLKSTNLPALFEADIDMTMTNYDNKPAIKISLLALKMVKYVPLFSK